MNNNKILDLSNKRNVYVVGDLHGYYNELMSKLIKIGFDFKQDALVAVGDLVDRGPNSYECLKLLNEDWFNSCRGNHEVMLTDSKLYKPMEEMHRKHGGQWFYELPDHQQQECIKLVYKMPLTLTVLYGGKRYGIAHADSCSEWQDNSLKHTAETIRAVKDHVMWSTSRFNAAKDGIYEHIENIDHVYFGHCPTRTIETIANYSFIDFGHWTWKAGIKLVKIDTREVI